MTTTITEAEVVKEEATKNKIKLTKWEIKTLFNPSFNVIKIADVKKEDRANLIKFKIALGKHDEEIKAYEHSVIESLKDDKFIELEKEAAKEEAKEELKEQFEELKNKISKEVNELLIEHYNQEVEIECELLSEETFYAIASSIELSALGGYSYLWNKLVK